MGIKMKRNTLKLFFNLIKKGALFRCIKFTGKTGMPQAVDLEITQDILKTTEKVLPKFQRAGPELVVVCSMDGVGNMEQCHTCTEPGLERYALPYEGFHCFCQMLKTGVKNFSSLHSHMGLD